MPSGSFLLLLLLLLCLFPLAFGDGADSPPAAEKTDTKAKEELASYSLTSTIMVTCLLLNLASVVILLKALQEARRTPEFIDKYRLSMHWLSRTAIRHSIGPSAKKILLEYVETKEKEEKEKKEKEKKK